MLVFQPRPGLGDLIWHLPIIRALAKQHGPVTLVTKPSTQADALLADDPDIARIVWFDRNPRQGRGYHDGPLGFPRLVSTLRNTGADSCVLLHHGASLAAATRLAGLRHRYGYGYTAAQRVWLNRGPFLDQGVRFGEAFDQARAYAAALGFADLPEPSVRIDEAARQRVLARLRHLPRPFLALGVGAHGSKRQWDARRFAALAALQMQADKGTVLVLGGAQEAELVNGILQETGPGSMQAVIGWPLPDIVALLAEVDVFLGNDSGLMNLRAACGRRAFGLFGASGPLSHSRLIDPIIPPGGARAGMDSITVESVYEALQTR